MDYEKLLNPEQLEAVKHDKGPLLILAGAGSGKTRVLTHRIAYLIDEYGVSPFNILALTFTNKAAKEMRERVDRIVGYGADNIWVSTFHSTCVRILRRYITKLGYDQSFTIYDTADQKTLIKDVCKSLDIDTKKFKEAAIMNKISEAKDRLKSPTAMLEEAGEDYLAKTYAKIYMEYQKQLKNNNALDFDDLIYKTVELFRNDEESLSYYQNRFKYIMVDEYQDTNHAQFVLISLLASTTNEYGEVEHNLCVVGDDDQSIYRFRGADIHNILGFESKFPNTKVIKLEQNYRSTKNILSIANEVIANNTNRKDKTLWTANEDGDVVSFTQYQHARDEAERIVMEIRSLHQQEQLSFNDFAILYRTNAQSRLFEEKLVQYNIPYKLVGGTNFYSRKEIKDLLAYLRVIDNAVDDISVKRIINVPKRGIGQTTINRIDEYATENNISFYDAVVHAQGIPGIGRAVEKLQSFATLIEALRSKIASPDYSIEDLVKELIDVTGYVRELEATNTVEANTRIEYIDEFITKVVTFEEESISEPSLSQFLEEVSLVADIDSYDEDEEKIVLMTLHGSKGLEFPYVYLTGMEEGIFPSYRSINSGDMDDIDEERRLCYVGITRARKRLSLSAARERMQNGETMYSRPSRFINEIPRYLIKSNLGESKSAFGGTNSFGKSSDFGGSYNNSSYGSSSYSSSNYSGSGFGKSSYGSAGYSNSGFSSSYGNSGFGKTTNSGSDLPQNLRSSGNGLDMLNNNPFIKKGLGTLSSLTSTAFDKPSTPAVINYKVGDKVSHIKFGNGKVTDMIPKDNNDYMVTVDFEEFGTKKMKASFAKLVKK